METKSFGIKMVPGAYAQAKTRAKQLNLRIGEYLANLISSMEFRLCGAYRAVGLDPDSDYNERLDATLISILLRHDEKSFSAQGDKRNPDDLLQELERAASKVRRATSRTAAWVPKICLDGEGRVKSLEIDGL